MPILQEVKTLILVILDLTLEILVEVLILILVVVIVDSQTFSIVYLEDLENLPIIEDLLVSLQMCLVEILMQRKNQPWMQG